MESSPVRGEGRKTSVEIERKEFFVEKKVVLVVGDRLIWKG